MSFFKHPLIFIDTETTGLSARFNRIIEIGFIKVEDGKIIERFSSLINPKQRLSSKITQITGITQKEVDEAPVFEEIFEQFDSKLKGYHLIAHWASFDLSFFESEYYKLDKDFKHKLYCSVLMSRRLYPFFRHHNLDSLIQRFNLSIQRRHRAFDDAELIYQFLKCAAREHGDNRLLEAFLTSKVK